ncbi:MAG: methionyl-tRNA formyltransferase [Bacillota bacterium]|nr:methionyl-tRNA formyltransferase [Bacillota bacterium]
MKIMFMGTPEFARVNLQKLVERGHDVCCVISQKDKPKGRGMELIMPPVKAYALEKGIPIYQPQTLKDNALSGVLDEYNPGLIVVVAYGKILPKYILDYPEYGCINVHGSLLPKYRGSAPVQWAVINGDKETGVTTMYMDEGMDTGDILLQEKFEILPKETSKMLMERMAGIGAELLIKTIDMLERGLVEPRKQNDKGATAAPMLSKEMGRIDWKRSAKEIQHMVYGMNPWPTAYFETEKGIVKVYEADGTDEESGLTCGQVVNADKQLIVQTGKGQLVIKELQLQGKKRMSAEDFLRGNKFERGKQF